MQLFKIYEITAEAVLRGKCIAMQTHINQDTRESSKNITLHLKELGKEKKIIPQG